MLHILVDEVAARPAAQRPAAVTGAVTAVSPLTVHVRGDAEPTVVDGRRKGYAPVVGEWVVVDVIGNQLIVAYAYEASA